MTKDWEYPPKPGSALAIKKGCTCPVIDNCYGDGVIGKSGKLYWYAGDCLIHAPKTYGATNNTSDSKKS